MHDNLAIRTLRGEHRKLRQHGADTRCDTLRILLVIPTGGRILDRLGRARAWESLQNQIHQRHGRAKAWGSRCFPSREHHDCRASCVHAQLLRPSVRGLLGCHLGSGQAGYGQRKRQRGFHSGGLTGTLLGSEIKGVNSASSCHKV